MNKNDDLKIEVQAELDEKQSKANITNDIKALEKTPFYIRLVGKLYKALTKENIEKDMKELNNAIPSIQLKGKLNRSATKQSLKSEFQKLGKDTNVTLGAEIDKKTLAQSIDRTTNSIEQSLKNNPVNIPINVDDNINNSAQQIQHINNQVRDSKNLFSEYLTARDIFRAITESIKKTIDEIEKLNKAQTDLQIATSKSTSEMKPLMQGYNQLAKDMSSTTLDVTGAADDYLRQGQSVSDTNTLIKDSLILSKVGQIESSQATEYLTSAMHGYKTEAKDVINIVDKLCAVDLQSASSSGELAESMSMCSNVARTSGIELDTLIAYLAVTKDVTQDSASAIGNAWKSIFTRLNNVKIGKFLDEDGNDISGEINDAERVLSSFNISLRNNAKEFRNVQDIIADVANAWDIMSSVEQAAVRKGFANTYQAEKITALFENYNKVLELTEVSQNSAGTAMDKFSIYEDSLEAATNRLKASFEGLAYNTIDSNFLKGLADGAAGIVDFVDSTKLLKTGLTAGIFTGAISGLVALGTKMIAVKNNVTQFTQAINLSRSSTAITGVQYDTLLNSVKGLTEAQLRLVLSSNQLTQMQRSELMQEAGIKQSRQKQLLQTWKLTNATNAQTTATFSLRGAWEGLKTSIATNPIGLIVTALTTATMVISKYKEKQEELKQKHEEEIQKSKELIDTFKEEHTTLETIINKYSELSQKTGLTADEKETLLDYQKQLVETYGKEASGIDLVNGKLENNLAILKSLNDENLKALEANQKKVYLDAKAKYDDFANEAVQNSTLLDEDTGKYIGVHRIEFDDKSFNGNVKNAIQGLINGDVPGIGGGIFAEHLQIDDDAIEILGNTNEDFEMAYAEMVKVLDEISKRSPMVGGVDFTTNSGYKTLLDGLNQLTALRDEAEKRANDLAQTKYAQFTLEKGNAPVNEADFKKWFEDLTEYVNPSGDSALKNALTDIVNSNSGRYVISDTDTGIDKVEQKSLSDIVSSTKTELDDYKKQIDKFVECQSTAKAALTELSESGTLSYETIKKLSEAGLESVISYNAATNSFTVNKEKLDELIGSQKDAIVANMEQSKSNIQLTAQQSKELQEIENWRKKTGRSTSDVIYQHKLEELGVKDITSSYDLYISMLEKADFATNDFSDTVSKTNQDIEKYSENISKISNSKSIVKSAQEEQEKFGRLSIDTIKSLHEAGLSGAMSYNEMTGETYLLVDAVDELTRAQIENQKVDINKSITETTNKIAEASERLRNIGNPSDAYTANMVSGLNQNIAQWQSQLDELGIQKMELGSLLFSFETDDESTKQSAEEAAEKAAEEYANAVKEAFNKEESELDHLKAMDVITEDTYYDSLAKIVKKYYSDKEMFLDEYRQYEEKIYDHLKQKQIDAIQEQIDALKSVNEEKQEEIDLEKAKQALENAKRNKTISVYDSERGWIHETDRKAIDTAQKEYDDLVLNEKIEALESMIDAIENGTNTIHSLDESVDVSKQVDGMVDLTKYFKNVDTETLNEMTQIRQSIYNGAGIPESLTNQFDKTIAKDSYVVNDNKTINLNGVTVKTDDPERFVSQMEQIANKSFDTKFMPAMNNLAEDIKRHRANHRYY